jgi:translocation and assembly module TamB
MTEPVTRPSLRRRSLRPWGWLAGVVGLFALLVAGSGWWASSEGSLPRALQIAQRFLPADQQLLFSDASGSITGGGRIGRLQWSKPGLAVTIDDLRLDWTLRLLRRDLQVRILSARNVQVRRTPQPEKPDDPFIMPPDASLPITVSTPLNIARVQIDSVAADATTSTMVLEDLAAHYRYDGQQHLLQLDSLGYGQSRLQGKLQLHARELTLSAEVNAALRDLVPDTPLAMQVRLQANGTLGGGDAAALDLRLDASEQAEAGAEVHAQATIHPWRKQPAQQLELQVSRLNAHSFHAAAPVTAIRGQASLAPAPEATSTTWNAVVEFTNDQPGAWDRRQLPLRKLAARARLSPELLVFEAAQADLGGSSAAGTVTLAGQVPLQELTRTALQMELQKVDLRPLMTTLPRTAFTGPVTVAPSQQDFSQIRADIRNALPGPFDQDRAPLERLLGELRIASDQWRIETLDLQIGDGRVHVEGTYAPMTQALDLRGELQRLPLRRIHRKMANDLKVELSGKVAVAGTLPQGLAFDADMVSDAAASAKGIPRGKWEIRAIQANGSWSPARLHVERVHLDAFEATLDGSGIDVALPDFRSIQARVTAAAPGVRLAADAAMMQQSGGGTFSLDLQSARQMADWLRGLPLVGERVPDLQASGAGTLKADWQGGWQQWIAGFRNPAAQPQLRLNAIAHSDGLRIDLPAASGQPPMRVDVQHLDLDVQGNLASATVAITSDGRVGDTRALLDMRLRTTQVRGTGSAPRWNIAVERLVASANLREEVQPWQLQLSENLQVTVQTGGDLELRATAGSATLSAPAGSIADDEPLRLAWQPVLWRRTASGANILQTSGSVTGLHPAWADTLLARRKGDGPLARAGMRTDLSLSGDWNIQMTDSVNIRAHIRRERGDLWLVDPDIAAGIRAFDLQLQSTGENVNLALDWDTERAGVIAATMGTRLLHKADGWSLPDDAPLSGSVKASVQNLATWTFLAPPGWRIGGALDANLRVAGTVQSPQLNGNVDGKGLNLRSVLDGVDLHDGRLHATLSGSRMDIAELVFQGGTGSRAHVRGFSGNRTPPPTERGSMTASGSIDWSGVRSAGEAETGIAMDLRAKLARMQVLVRNDRQMTLSGDLSAGLAQGALRIRGDLTVDRASIVLPEASAPTLGDDVVVIRNADLANPGAVEARQARGQLETRKPLDMEIQLDLGRDLALQGQGIATRLEGELTVRSANYGSGPFSIFGEVRTVEGRYRAWGQALNVETGVVRFNGPYSNPSLNLLAIRPDIEVRAGVRVTGTLNAPRVQLYSEPDLPEGEKLSWVVLGRPAVIAGAEGTSMQQAALGVAAGQLSGKLASGIGLDELGLAESGVTIGKRLSNELYLTYEAGLSGAASTLFIFYDLTRRLTVRAQTGEATAVDLVYTIKFD